MTSYLYLWIEWDMINLALNIPFFPEYPTTIYRPGIFNTDLVHGLFGVC